MERTPITSLTRAKGIQTSGCVADVSAYLGNMDWQEITALSIVAATAAIFIAKKFRRKKFSFQRDTHCGCSSGTSARSRGSIIFHARKGERGEIIMKMK